ncbi:SecY subunit domain-containing protein [Phellopilus nigrolimitatus]|nr:SecY subunit domain-containing protein [Phellopilus nigrolimitatus]
MSFDSSDPLYCIISPILLAGANLIDVDFSLKEDRALFGGVQKLFALDISLGLYGSPSSLGPGVCLLLILQLVAAAFIIILLDELLQKGYGLGSGISLFIATNSCEYTIWKAFLPTTDNTGHGPEFEDAVIELFHLLFTWNVEESAFREVFWSEHVPKIMNLAATVVVLGSVIYLQGLRLEIPIKNNHFREASSPPLLGGSNAPCAPYRRLTAASALLGMFAQLAFADYVMTPSQARLALFVFERLLKLLRAAPYPCVRVAILQLLMWLHADRDHRAFLARMAWGAAARRAQHRHKSDEAARNEEIFADRARARQTFERNDRWKSRRRGSRTSVREDRSLSKAAGRAVVQPMASVNTKPRDGRRVLVTYEPHKPSDGVVLPLSDYIDVPVELLKAQRDWDVLSYSLVHLLVQLAYKHFGCGPRDNRGSARRAVQRRAGWHAREVHFAGVVWYAEDATTVHGLPHADDSHQIPDHLRQTETAGAQFLS